MRKLVVVVIGIFLSFSVYAQDSKRESVEELLRVSNMDSMIDGMYSQMNQMFVGLEEQLDIKPDEQPIFDAHMNKLITILQEDMSWEKFKEPLIDIYLKHYTEKEIQDMLAFYQTETGRSMVSKMPLVMNDSMLFSQEMMKSLLPKIQSLAQELKAEIQKHRNQK